MWQIKKITNNETNIQYQYKLTGEERAALADVYVKADMVVSTKTKTLADTLVAKAKRLRYWFACDCVQKSPPPMLTVGRYASGTLHLKKVPKFGDHDPKCDFYRVIRMVEAGHKPTTAIKTEKLFREYKRIHQIDTPHKISTTIATRGGQTTRLPILARKLYTLLETSNWNKARVTPFSLKEQYQALSSVIARYQIETDVSLKEYFWTLPWQFIDAIKKLKIAAFAWPRTSLPQGFFLLVAQSIEKNTLICRCKGKEFSFTLKGQLKKSSGRLGEASTPYLVFFTVAELFDGSNYFEPLDGFAVPVYSNEVLIPVESHYERIVLKRLRIIQQAFKDKRNVDLIIEKPLFDVLVENNGTAPSVCRPDFLLKANQRCVVLEVMGSQENDYLVRKKGTHAIMEKLGSLREIDAESAERLNQWDERLNTMAREIYSDLLK